MQKISFNKLLLATSIILFSPMTSLYSMNKQTQNSWYKKFTPYSIITSIIDRLLSIRTNILYTLLDTSELSKKEKIDALEYHLENMKYDISNKEKSVTQSLVYETHINPLDYNKIIEQYRRSHKKTATPPYRTIRGHNVDEFTILTINWILDHYARFQAPRFNPDPEIICLGYSYDFQPYSSIFSTKTEGELTPRSKIYITDSYNLLISQYDKLAAITQATMSLIHYDNFKYQSIEQLINNKWPDAPDRFVEKHLRPLKTVLKQKNDIVPSVDLEDVSSAIRNYRKRQTISSMRSYAERQEEVMERKLTSIENDKKPFLQKTYLNLRNQWKNRTNTCTTDDIKHYYNISAIDETKKLINHFESEEIYPKPRRIVFSNRFAFRSVQKILRIKF